MYCLQVFQWTHETPPDQRKPLDTYYNENTGRLCSYQLEVCTYIYVGMYVYMYGMQDSSGLVVRILGWKSSGFNLNAHMLLFFL